MAIDFKGKKTTVNQTGRIKILRTNYTFNVAWPKDGTSPPSLVEIAVTIPDTCGAGSLVFADVWVKSKYMRFDCGTKANIQLPDDVELTDIGRNTFNAQIRVVDPTDQRLVLARTAEVPIYNPDPKPPKVGGNKEGGEKDFQLFHVTKADFGGSMIPIRLEFPEAAQKPVVIKVNQDCQDLHDELRDVGRSGIYALAVLPYLRSILQRVVSDCGAGVFDPSENIHSRSTWQALWNYWAETISGEGLENLDDYENDTVDKWIESVLDSYCMTIGNPARQVNRLMGGA